MKVYTVNSLSYAKYPHRFVLKQPTWFSFNPVCVGLCYNSHPLLVVSEKGFPVRRNVGYRICDRSLHSKKKYCRLSYIRLFLLCWQQKLEWTRNFLQSIAKDSLKIMAQVCSGPTVKGCVFYLVYLAVIQPLISFRGSTTHRRFV